MKLNEQPELVDAKLNLLMTTILYGQKLHNKHINPWNELILLTTVYKIKAEQDLLNFNSENTDITLRTAAGS